MFTKEGESQKQNEDFATGSGLLGEAPCFLPLTLNTATTIPSATRVQDITKVPVPEHHMGAACRFGQRAQGAAAQHITPWLAQLLLLLFQLLLPRK